MAKENLETKAKEDEEKIIPKEVVVYPGGRTPYIIVIEYDPEGCNDEPYIRRDIIYDGIRIVYSDEPRKESMYEVHTRNDFYHIFSCPKERANKRFKSVEKLVNSLLQKGDKTHNLNREVYWVRKNIPDKAESILHEAREKFDRIKYAKEKEDRELRRKREPGYCDADWL